MLIISHISLFLTFTFLLVGATPIGPQFFPEISSKTLDLFFKSLRSCIVDTIFIAPLFESKQKELTTYYTSIQDMAAKSYPNDEISKQVQFSGDKYHQMKASVDYRKENTMGYPSKDLIYNIDDLLISLLIVQDSVGEPDPFVPHYRNLVSKFRNRFQIIEDKSRALPLEPKITLQVARAKLDFAGKTIEEMEEYYPPEDLHKSGEHVIL